MATLKLKRLKENNCVVVPLSNWLERLHICLVSQILIQGCHSFHVLKIEEIWGDLRRNYKHFWGDLSKPCRKFEEHWYVLVNLTFTDVMKQSCMLKKKHHTYSRSFIKRQTSGTTSDNEWQRVKTNDNEWYNDWQQGYRDVFKPILIIGFCFTIF